MALVDLAPLDGDGVPRRHGFDKAGQARPVIFNLFRRDSRQRVIATLYERVASASRQPALYAELGVPDTLEGRFEALSLHMVLALRVLRELPPPADEVGRDLTDAFFRDLDASLREMGVGDTAVPKRMKKLGEAFFGRARAYDLALNTGDEDALALALGRNITGQEAPAGNLARYARAVDTSSKALTLDAILGQGFTFPPPGGFAGEGIR
jgi:cytochrome b pre-mRNA-processing protein 3